MKIPLRSGPLRADGYKIHRSDVRWLCESGQICRANQVVAYFNLNLVREGSASSGSPPFAEEKAFQVACAPRVAGRLVFDSTDSPGGFFRILCFNLWDADNILGHLEIDGLPVDAEGDPGRMRLLFLAGRRITPYVDVGLLPGWHSRSRAWWCEGGSPVTLLSLGVCDVHDVVMGEQYAFLEMFRAEAAPSQFVLVPDNPVTPASPVLLDQIERTAAQFQEISTDMRAGLCKDGATLTADDWMFAGTVLSMLQHSPVRETYDILSDAGLSRTGPPAAVLLSLLAEPAVILRHKRIGYRLHFMRHHQAAAGPAIRNWLADAFEPVRRTTHDIKRDYENLIDAIGKSTGARVVILNRMSTSGDENISTYASFDAPMSGMLANIASKELNLMLHDIAAERDVAIIDVDAIAADIGGGEHISDGVHQSRAMQDVLRAEILQVMAGLRPRV
jgi:hypothetical protein